MGRCVAGDSASLSPCDPHLTSFSTKEESAPNLHQPSSPTCGPLPPDSAPRMARNNGPGGSLSLHEGRCVTLLDSSFVKNDVKFGPHRSRDYRATHLPDDTTTQSPSYRSYQSCPKELLHEAGCSSYLGGYGTGSTGKSTLFPHSFQDPS